MSELNKVKLEETNRGKHSISDSLQISTRILIVTSRFQTYAYSILLLISDRKGPYNIF